MNKIQKTYHWHLKCDLQVQVTSALAELKSEKEVAATSVSSVFQACPRAMFSSVLGHVMGRAGSFHPVSVVSAFQLLCKAVPERGDKVMLGMLGD